MQKFLFAQIKKIEIDKWCKGLYLKADPGQEYVLNWISENAAWFREAWTKSLCRSCCQYHECGHEVAQSCDNYEED